MEIVVYGAGWLGGLCVARNERLWCFLCFDLKEGKDDDDDAAVEDDGYYHWLTVLV